MIVIYNPMIVIQDPSQLGSQFHCTEHCHYNHKLHITIANYNHKTFIVQATGLWINFPSIVATLTHNLKCLRRSFPKFLIINEVGMQGQGSSVGGLLLLASLVNSKTLKLHKREDPCYTPPTGWGWRCPWCLFAPPPPNVLVEPTLQ